MTSKLVMTFRVPENLEAEGYMQCMIDFVITTLLDGYNDKHLSGIGFSYVWPHKELGE